MSTRRWAEDDVDTEAESSNAVGICDSATIPPLSVESRSGVVTAEMMRPPGRLATVIARSAYEQPHQCIASRIVSMILQRGGCPMQVLNRNP